MDSDEQIKFSYTLDDEAFKLGVARNYSYRHSVRKLLMPLFGSIMIVGAIGLFFTDPRARVLPVVLLILGVIYILSKKIYVRRIFKRFKAGKGDDSTYVEVSASASGITMDVGNANGFTQWSAFVDRVLVKEGLLLYPQKFLFVFIPHQLEFEVGTWDKFVALIHAGVERKV